MDTVLARYRAPWGLLLKAITVSTTVLLVGIAIAGVFYSATPKLQTQPLQTIWFLAMVVLPLGIVLGAALFMVRGYTLTRTHLQIQRLMWQTQLDLQTLVSAEVNPKAIAGSWRLWGNGGLFVFAGLFRNAALGNYWAYATDLKRCVVIKLTHRTIVVTPDRPDDLVAQLNLLAQQ